MIVRVNVVLKRNVVVESNCRFDNLCSRTLLTLKMTTAQVVETSVTVDNNNPIQDYVTGTIILNLPRTIENNRNESTPSIYTTCPCTKLGPTL